MPKFVCEIWLEVCIEFTFSSKETFFFQVLFKLLLTARSCLLQYSVRPESMFLPKEKLDNIIDNVSNKRSKWGAKAVHLVNDGLE